MKRAQRRKYHYIYKTTCKVTNKYYYGMHSTDNLDDGYIGSGKRLWYSIRKHGIENHVCEKKEFFETRKKLKDREIEIINENLLKDPLCMNLVIGGEGGGGFRSEEHRIKFLTNGQKQRSIKGNIQKTWLLKNDQNWTDNYRKNVSDGVKKTLQICNHWKGKKHTNETIEKMKESHKGKHEMNKNRRWISKENQIKRIDSKDLENYLNNGWKIGRKLEENFR